MYNFAIDFLSQKFYNWTNASDIILLLTIFFTIYTPFTFNLIKYTLLSQTPSY